MTSLFLADTNHPFSSLRGGYNFIMADPAWNYEMWSEKGHAKSPHAQYECMKLDDIKALPILDLCAPDCLLWLWHVSPMIPQMLEVCEAWGFEYRTSGVWVKMTKNGKQSFNTGYCLRNSHEPFAIAKRGNPSLAKNVRSAFFGLQRQHSRKPQEAYREAEKLMPNARRLDLFSRETRAGWDNWGFESTKFDEVAK